MPTPLARGPGAWGHVADNCLSALLHHHPLDAHNLTAAFATLAVEGVYDLNEVPAEIGGIAPKPARRPSEAVP